ncbi:MAG: protein-disulfide reductase DsbD [Pseudomonadota bacterium]
MTLYKQLNKLVTVLVPLSIIIGAVLGLNAQAQFFAKKQPVLLPETEAFMVTQDASGRGLAVNWSIADDYYMYRDQFQVEIDVAGTNYPLELTFANQGVIEDDPEFGAVEVFFFNASFQASLPDTLALQASTPYQLTLKGQGCNKPVGVCYPPMARTTEVTWSAAALGADSATVTVEQKQRNFAAPQKASSDKTMLAYIVSAFFAGILLSFTPCVLPMIPILSGVIAKQHAPSKLKAGWLAICYVVGTIITYTIAGWIAGATGTQLQAYFQNPWVIGILCSVLVLLAASLFGAFRIETPASLQTKIHSTSHNDEGNDAILSLKSFSLGLVSALVVGACVSPVLILALGAAITQGDPVLGAAIMGSMALGMGVLLIAFGFGAGWLLPKTGAWMTQIQTLFGLGVLGVAIFIASGLQGVPVLLLWSALMISTGFYLWQQASSDELSKDAALFASILKAVSFGLVLWGAMALVGHATGGRDITAPLSELSLGSGPANKIELPFQTTTTLTETQSLLDQAQENQKPVFVDFYADWCLDCQRMKRTTFREQSVANALSDWQLIEIDVTTTNNDSETLKKFFGVFGPPASIFIDRQGEELSDLRQYGYIAKNDFLGLIQSANQ